MVSAAYSGDGAPDGVRVRPGAARGARAKHGPLLAERQGELDDQQRDEQVHDQQREFLGVLAAERRAFALPPQLPNLVERLLDGVLALLFPHFTAEVGCRQGEVAADHDAVRRLVAEAADLPGLVQEPRTVANHFMGQLPAVRAAMLRDARAIYDGDPAATSLDEVILGYPGFLAAATYRVGHELHNSAVPLLPRLLTELAHRTTGVDIHPAARIGASLAIDHGTGVVVGETAVLGDRVRLYQGVTLGAASVSKRQQGTKRHPTIGDDVIIYANATILGGDTVVGEGSRIGGNVWLTHSVPPRSIVTNSAGIERRRETVDSARSTEDVLEYHI